MKSYNLQGTSTGAAKLPPQFNEEIRPDVIKRAVLAIQGNKRQQYGSDPKAGMKYSSNMSRRRRKFRGGYGRGISRVPRKVMLRRGSQFIYVGATVSNTVGGRKIHSPKSEKILSQKINNKERLKAIRSAIAATNNVKLLQERGYKAESLVVKDLEKINKTKDLRQLLINLKLKEDLSRSLVKRIRAGIGKLRGRKYKRTKGPLIVISDSKADVFKATKNLAGFDVAVVNSLNAELLAPGAVPGRLTIWSEAALTKMEKEKLFIK